MDEKIQILNNINTDDARFLINIIKSYNSYIKDMKEKHTNTKIVIDRCDTNLDKGIINLDSINADRYFYTKMKLRIKHIIELISKKDTTSLGDKKILHNIIYSKPKEKIFTLEKNKMDIVELIKILSEKNITNIKMVANKITDINLFKEEQISMAIEIIKIQNKNERVAKVYDFVYDYLKKDFIANNYCDFIEDKCIAQRRFHIYPLTNKDGCCFMQIRKCNHLKNGECDTQCMACRLFSCPYLTKRGIGYYANELVLLKAFFDKSQRKILVFEFYKSKEQILKKIDKKMSKD